MRWGVDDCMLAVADVVMEITGKDPAKPFRGRYTTKRGALRVMGRGGTLKAANDAARRLRWRGISPHSAGPGDVGLMLMKGEDMRGRQVTVYAAMICRAPGWFVGRNEAGFTGFPASKLVKAWRTG